jgi:hypothetical protein
MLFPRNPAKGGTSGPQACFFAEKGIEKVKVGKLSAVGKPLFLSPLFLAGLTPKN